jgi:hypothetical protein
MSPVLAPLTGLVLAAIAVLACTDTPTGPSGTPEPTPIPAPGEPGFVSIFDGRSFDAWTGAVEGYEIRDGAIVCKAGAGGTLHTRKIYRNFVVRFEFRLPPAGNNGLAIRYPGTGDPAYAGMTELQVLDDPDPKYKDIDPRQAHGSAYGMVASKRGHLKPAGEWNEQEVTVQGSTIRVVLNGTTILDADLSTVTSFMADTPHPGKDRTEGFFGFAGHNDPVAFRNIRLRELP